MGRGCVVGGVVVGSDGSVVSVGGRSGWWGGWRVVDVWSVVERW